MRVLSLVAVAAILAATAAVACGGEVAPDTSGQTASSQKAADGTTTPPSSATTSTGGSPATAGSSGSDPASCWTSVGDAAPGECTVNETRFCDGYVDMTSSGVVNGKPFCEELCTNVNGVATWGFQTKNQDCPFADTALHASRAACADVCVGGPGQQQAQSSSTPLVLSFDDAPVSFTAANAGGAFDLVADGSCHGSDWPTAKTPWLALDRDGNGSIDDGSELFGSATRLASGQRATNGFEALRDLDANQDGIFDAQDPAFAKLVVWTDRNGDRRSSPGELTSLAEAGVTSISLRDRREMRCDARGNCEGERSSFARAGGHAGAVVDVYLKTR